MKSSQKSVVVMTESNYYCSGHVILVENECGLKSYNNQEPTTIIIITLTILES